MINVLFNEAIFGIVLKSREITSTSQNCVRVYVLMSVIGSSLLLKYNAESQGFFPFQRKCMCFKFTYVILLCIYIFFFFLFPYWALVVPKLWCAKVSKMIYIWNELQEITNELLSTPKAKRFFNKMKLCYVKI